MATNVLNPNEPRRVTVVESELSHEDPGDGFVDSGQPVLHGSRPGVALIGADADTDLVAVAREGEFIMTVLDADDVGAQAIVAGDIIYYDGGDLNVDATNGTRWGYACEAVDNAGAGAAIRVEVGY